MLCLFLSRELMFLFEKKHQKFCSRQPWRRFLYFTLCDSSLTYSFLMNLKKLTSATEKNMFRSIKSPNYLKSNRERSDSNNVEKMKYHVKCCTAFFRVFVYTYLGTATIDLIFLRTASATATNRTFLIPGDAEDLLCGDSRLPIMRMFSANGLNVLLSLMERLHASLQHVCHGVRSMSGCLCASVHSTVVSLTRSCVFLLLHMLGQLVDANIDSKAISGERIAQVAVALYSDIYIMLRPTDPFLLDDLTSKFVSILSLFFMHDCCADLTAPVLTGLVNHAESHCDCFVPTLTLLSQLLPIPLPIVSEEEPGEDAKAAVTAVCKRWADYLTPHVDRVLSLLLPLSSSSCRPVLNVCVALCQQMIDLSPDTALAIAKKYKDQIAPLLVNTGAEDQDGDDAAADESSGEKGLVLSPEQVTTIENFAEIITLPSAKAAFISSIHEEGEGMLDLWQYASSSLSPKEAVAEVLLLASVMIDADISLRSEVSSPSDIFPPAMHLRQIAILATQQLTNSSEIVYCRALLVISHFLQSR